MFLQPQVVWEIKVWKTEIRMCKVQYLVRASQRRQFKQRASYEKVQKQNEDEKALFLPNSFVFMLVEVVQYFLVRYLPYIARNLQSMFATPWTCSRLPMIRTAGWLLFPEIAKAAISSVLSGYIWGAHSSFIKDLICDFFSLILAPGNKVRFVYFRIYNLPRSSSSILFTVMEINLRSMNQTPHNQFESYYSSGLSW